MAKEGFRSGFYSLRFSCLEFASLGDDELQRGEMGTLSGILHAGMSFGARASGARSRGGNFWEMDFLPYGELFQQLAKGGFVLIALAVVAVLAFRGSEGRANIRNNKAKNNRPRRSRHNELGSGDLAVKSQIQKWITRDDDLDTLLPVKDIKGGDGIALKQGCLVIPPEERNRHVLIIAKTGSGKTTRAILPVLFNDCLCPTRSTIVLDSKPEMWDKLVGITRKYNPEKRVLLFNPLDMARGLSWNILAKIDTDTDAKLIANTIISATDNPASKSDSPFFRNNALSLLNSVMVGLLMDKEEKLSMPRVHQLVNGGMENLCKWIEAHPEALRNSKTFVDLARSGSQNADTIMSELGMRLSAWDLSAIRATTALDELDLESLIAHPTLLVIELRESELEMLRPMANVIVVEMLRYLTKRAETFPGGKLPRPIGIVIDEFASALGRLPDIHVKLNTLRSRNVSIFAAIQSINQIKANYDRDADSVLSGFSTKIFMPTLDFQDAEWASKESGTMTVRYNLASVGKNKRLIDYFATKNDNTQEQVQQRAVLTPDEIGRPADNAATFFMPNTPVFQGHLVPYYEVPSLTQRLEAAKGIDFKLREKPIEFIDELPVVTATEVAPTQSPEEIRKAFDEVRVAVSYDAADPISKEWWGNLEKLNERSPAAVFNLGQQLTRRNLPLAEFYSIYATSGIDNVDDLMRSIDERLMQELRVRLGFDIANQHAKDWWVSFEEANKVNTVVVIELGQELLRRNVGIEDFFSAYVHSDCNSVPEILQLLDHLIAQKQAEVIAAQMQQYQSPVASSPDHSAATEIADSAGPFGSPSLGSQIEVDSYSVRAAEVPSFGGPLEPSTVAAPLSETPLSPSSSASAGSGEPINSAPLKKDRHKQAVRSVHVDSYLEMGKELLDLGKVEDFHKLIDLAKNDANFPAEMLPLLQEMIG